MGSELISAVMEIPRDVQPNWAKAEQYILDLTDLQVLNYHSDILGLGDEYCEEDIVELNSHNGVNSDLAKKAKYAREALLNSLQSCKDGWECSHRQMNKITLSNSVILLAAGESWGDNVSQCDDIILFANCGAAEVAGFF